MKGFSGGIYMMGGAEPHCTLGNFEMDYMMDMGFIPRRIPTMKVSSLRGYRMVRGLASKDQR